MKEFFWAIIAAYVFLYFYAAWLYDGFSIPLAIALFVALVVHIFWWKKRKKLKEQSETIMQVAEKPNVEPLSMWASPFPYMIVLVLALLIVTFI